MCKERITKALASVKGIDALIDLAVDLNNEGFSKQSIYDVFHTYSLKLTENNEAEKATLLEDVLDMITGWYVGKNIKLKD